MSKRGFTLIELLAVIAILAIILLIAVPIVLSIIDSSKKSAYKQTEGMLSKAGSTYLAGNQSLIPTIVGVPVVISYNDLKTNNFITPILDATTKTECTNSKVYVTKNADGSITYKPGIVCDNYISIDTFDLLNGAGKFAKDSNTDGLADGITNGGANTFSLNSGIQKFTPTSQWGCITKDSIPQTLGDIFYGFVYAKSSSNQTAMQIGDQDSNPSDSKYHTGSGKFEFLSGRMQTTAATAPLYHGIRVRSWLTTGWTEIEVKQMYMINLTSIYGAGSEPTKTVMDEIIKKSL